MNVRTWQELVKSPGGLRVSTEVKQIERTSEGTKILFLASTGIVDRDGESIDPMGWEWNEQKLPNQLYGHDSRTPENWIGKGIEVRKDSSGLYFGCMLFDKAPTATADLARQMAWIAENHLDAISCSVGFMPKKWRDPNGQVYTIDQPGASYPWSTAGRKYLAQELLENSIVPIPSNIEALALTVRSLIARAGGPPEAPITLSTYEEHVASVLAKSAELSALLAKTQELAPEDTTPEYDAAWLALGVKHVISRPSRKAGAVVSRADLDTLTSAKDAMTAFVATARPAEEAA